ncbi:MAG: hypothetical protein Q3985_00840 [Eubacteriales bacterium]|nr:hypothetical protein [Eubacteriales bacterium]
MIICKEELTTEYLFRKLGFNNQSRISDAGMSLVNDIIYGTTRGVRWFEIDTIDYANVLKIFGEKSAEKFKELSKKGFHTYIGHISSDDEYLTSFMAVDSFVINEKDFYMDGKNCTW